MNETLFEIAGRVVTAGDMLLAAAAGIAFLIVTALAIAIANRRALAQRLELERQLAELVRSQAEMTGRMQTMAEVFGTRQADLVRHLNERLDGVGHRIGQNLEAQTRATHDNLSKLNERLAVIDTAQKKITELSQEVVSLQQILANKQSRGAFGQGLMEAIVRDGLPPDAVDFQATLSNGRRPDCLIRLPGSDAALVVDAKFPLEAFTAYRAAETGEARKLAQTQLRSDVGKHVSDIRERYFIPGETQDLAIMFVPSESIYADLHEHFDDVIQKAHRTRVILVGPSMLMLAIQVMQSILRDQRMREQAHLIHKEVTILSEDVRRLGERVGKLKTHFDQARTDIDQIETSAGKITKRGEKIAELDFGDGAEDAGAEQRALMAGE
jgi:DNA recombination protein RmuC